MNDGQNIREFMGDYIGLRVMEISQNDQSEFNPEDPKSAYVSFLFEDGREIRFFTPPMEYGPAFEVDHKEGCACGLCREDG